MVRFALTAAFVLLVRPAFAQEKPPTIWDPAYSGNYKAVSYDRGIEYVVVHTIEGPASAGRNWFKNPAANVSAHYVVDYDGTIWQMVKDKDIAWHAGNSYYNAHSIGIEFAGYTNSNYWTAAQYQAGAAIVAWASAKFGFPAIKARILGHKEVPGATHGDPGPYFNWSYFLSLLGAPSPPGPAPAPTPASESVVQVNASALNVRTGPGTGYAVQGLVSSGQRYVSIATSGGWKKLYFKGNVGWAYGGYLTPKTGGAGVTIAASSLNVRTGPSTAYAVSGVTHAGEKYVRISTSGAWARIYWGGQQRWIHGGYATTFAY